MQFRFLLLSLVTTLFASIAFGQTTATKIGVVSSYQFSDEKTGITKYVNANKALNIEFTHLQNELNAMNTRLQALSKEIENLRKLPAADPKAIDAKMEEGEKLQRDIKFKTEDAKSKFIRREQQVLGPVSRAIGSGLEEYARLKGYSLIFDASKNDNGFLVAIGDQSVDVTTDFIKFYNAKP